MSISVKCWANIKKKKKRKNESRQYIFQFNFVSNIICFWVHKYNNRLLAHTKKYIYCCLTLILLWVCDVLTFNILVRWEVIYTTIYLIVLMRYIIYYILLIKYNLSTYLKGCRHWVTSPSCQSNHIKFTYCITCKYRLQMYIFV